MGGVPSTCDRARWLHTQTLLKLSLSDVLSLQNAQLFIADEVEVSWVYTTVPPGEIREPEYSPQFAEKIIAADCGEWTQISADDLIAELDEMIKNAIS